MNPTKEQIDEAELLLQMGISAVREPQLAHAVRIVLAELARLRQREEHVIKLVKAAQHMVNDAEASTFANRSRTMPTLLDISDDLLALQGLIDALKPFAGEPISPQNNDTPASGRSSEHEDQGNSARIQQ